MQFVLLKNPGKAGSSRELKRTVQFTISGNAARANDGKTPPHTINRYGHTGMQLMDVLNMSNEWSIRSSAVCWLRYLTRDHSINILSYLSCHFPTAKLLGWTHNELITNTRCS